MSRLSIFPDHGDGGDGALPLPKLVCNDPASIQAELADRCVGFEQWPAAHALPPDADQSTILATYATEVARVLRDGGYQTVDAIRMTPDHPEREALRNKFLSEHTHAEDEVRFFVEGQGLFSLHINQEVLVTLCERGDLISVPGRDPPLVRHGTNPIVLRPALFQQQRRLGRDLHGRLHC